MTVASLVEWITGLNTQVDGITISGGEPFDQPNALRDLLSAIASNPTLRDADVLAYSGYRLSVLRKRHKSILGMLDAIISGPYIVSRPTRLPWRGSSNQRLTLLTDRATARYLDSEEETSRLQVTIDGGSIWLTGIPRPGDLLRLEHALDRQGVKLGNTSWTL